MADGGGIVSEGVGGEACVADMVGEEQEDAERAENAAAWLLLRLWECLKRSSDSLRTGCPAMCRVVAALSEHGSCEVNGMPFGI